MNLHVFSVKKKSCCSTVCFFEAVYMTRFLLSESALFCRGLSPLTSVAKTVTPECICTKSIFH